MHAIHTDIFDCVVIAVSADTFFVVIINVIKNKQIYQHDNLLLDEVLLCLTSYNIPVPKNFRAILFRDSLFPSLSNEVHYYFSPTGEEIARTHRLDGENPEKIAR